MQESTLINLHNSSLDGFNVDYFSYTHACICMYACLYVVQTLIPFLLQSQREDERELFSEGLTSVAGFIPPVLSIFLFSPSFSITLYK